MNAFAEAIASETSYEDDPAYKIWGVPSTPSLAEHARLCDRFAGASPTEVAVAMEWIDEAQAAAIRGKLGDTSNVIREVNALITAHRHIDRHRQHLFAITERTIFLESLREEGVMPHEALGDDDVFRACERHDAILIDVHGHPVLFFGERETGMRSFIQIAGVERANDPLRKRFPDLAFGLSRTEEVIALRSQRPAGQRTGADAHDSDASATIIYDAEMRRSGSDGIRKLAEMHDLALTREASDIHISINHEGRPNVAFRILGDITRSDVQLSTAEYVEVQQFLTKRSGAAIKYEQMRRPKDGMYQYIGTSKAKKAYVRASFIPNGTSQSGVRQDISICLRMIAEESGSVILEEKGVRRDVADYLRRAVTPDAGIVLLVGPTGSGKSTTIAGTVHTHRQIHGDSKIRLAIEDPVERYQEGIEQFQVPYDLRGMPEAFSVFLRNFLRHDPNLIIVGEIRDEVTAKVSIQAASTGHLVISTLHADSAYKTVQRLTDMIPSEDRSMRAAMIDNLSLIVAQRLVKKLCPHCCIPGPPTERESEHLAYVNRMKALTLELPKEVRHHNPAGCKHCNYLGYAGRLPVNEVLEITEDVKQIFRNPDPIEQNALIKQALSLRMEDCILDAVRDGLTPLRSLEI